MTGAEFRRLRLQLDPSEYPEHMPAAKPGPGRKPSGEITQRVLAEILGVTRDSVSRWETEKHPIPQWAEREIRRLVFGAQEHGARLKK